MIQEQRVKETRNHIQNLKRYLYIIIDSQVFFYEMKIKNYVMSDLDYVENKTRYRPKYIR